jgi:hypothetical protein
MMVGEEYKASLFDGRATDFGAGAIVTAPSIADLEIAGLGNGAAH